MGSYTGLNVRKITMDTPGNTDMLSSISKAYWDLVDCDGGDSFLIINKKFMARSSKSHEFGLHKGKSNTVRPGKSAGCSLDPEL